MVCMQLNVYSATTNRELLSVLLSEYNTTEQYSQKDFINKFW